MYENVGFTSQSVNMETCMCFVLFVRECVIISPKHTIIIMVIKTKGLKFGNNF